MRPYSDEYLEWIDYQKRGGRLDYEEWFDKFVLEDDEEFDYGDDDDY